MSCGACELVREVYAAVALADADPAPAPLLPALGPAPSALLGAPLASLLPALLAALAAPAQGLRARQDPDATVLLTPVSAQ